jgi:hypothetical protein
MRQTYTKDKTKLNFWNDKISKPFVKEKKKFKRSYYNQDHR